MGGALDRNDRPPLKQASSGGVTDGVGPQLELKIMWHRPTVTRGCGLEGSNSASIAGRHGGCRTDHRRSPGS